MTEAEFDLWRDDRVTRAFFAWVEGRREELKEQWAGGALSGPSIEETTIRNVAAVGAASAYEEMLNVVFDQLEAGDETGRRGE